jgi:murein L,D-transpeptidase YcbB/YkuD
MRKSFVAISTLLLLFLFACKSKTQKEQEREREQERKEVEIDKSITSANAFNNLFLDSNKLNDFLANHPEYSAYGQQYQDFYRYRNYEYAWFDTSGISEQAVNFVNLLNSTIADLNDSSLYNKKMMSLYNKFLTDSTAHEEKSPLQAELYLTGQFFMYVAKIYDAVDINTKDLGWFIPRKKVDFTTMLDSTVANRGKGEDRILPLNNQYKKLQTALIQYYSIRDKDSWDSIPPSGKGYKMGDSSTAIALIKHRLHLFGDMPPGDTTGKYNEGLKAAIQSFQARMGMPTTGILNKATIRELNYPIMGRIKQLLINLERDRWMPAETDSAYIMVNIPEYKLHVYEGARQQFDMNVIVGKAGTGTVIFTGKLKYIVFSPYWNVPKSIVEKEIVPGMEQNPDYLANHNMEVTGQDNGLPVVRQLPGDSNSLGHVKFLFPNSYDIYLHDTPQRDLFTATNRSFSHGCIRVQYPDSLARYLLRDKPEWTPEKIDSCMHLQDEKWVTLDKPVRVYIGYFTAWVDEDGRLNFRKDIYGHDKKMAHKLFANSPASNQALTLAGK